MDTSAACSIPEYSLWLRNEITEFLYTFSDVPNNIDKVIDEYEVLVDNMKVNCEQLNTDKTLWFLYQPEDEGVVYDTTKVHTNRLSCLVNFLELTKDKPEIFQNNLNICREVYPKTQELLKQYQYLQDNKDKIPVWKDTLQDRVDKHCCHYSCDTCDGPREDDCLSCNENNNRELIGNTCPPKKGFFEKPDTPKAPSCHYSCAQCTDETNTSCTECKADRDLAKNCECNTKMFEDQSQTCQPCNYSCKACDGLEANDCTDCSTELGRQKLLGECTPVEQSFDNGNEQTEKCHYSCQKCDGPLKTDCTACWENLTDVAGEDTFRTLTNDECLCLNPKFTVDLDDEKQCKACHCTCNSCSGVNYNECTADGGCPENSHFEQGKCKENCGFYFPEITEATECPISAEPCHYSCHSCFGPAEDQCSECDEQKQRELQGTSCICKQGVDNGISMQCKINCHYTCGDNCTGEDEDQCEEPCVRHRFYENGFCKPEPGFYDDKVTVPKKCNEACKTCTDGTNGSCETCNGAGRELSTDYANIRGAFNGICICKEGWTEDKENYDLDCTPCGKRVKKCQKVNENTIPIECVDEQFVVQGYDCVCKDGTYLVGDICLPCTKNCLTCKEFSNRCTSCKGEMRTLYENTCPCDEGYFTNNDSECEKCHPVCKNCVGALESQCTVAVSNLIKKPDTNLIMHYDFILDNSVLTDITYQDPIPGTESKYDVIKLALSTFMINRNEENWELGFFDKSTLITADNNGTILYQEEEINQDLLEKIPEETYDGVPNLDQALIQYENILKQRPEDELTILTIIMGENCSITLSNLDYLKTSVKVHEVRIPTLQQQGSTCLYDAIKNEMPEKVKVPEGNTNQDFEDPEEFVEYFGPIELPGFAPECIDNYYENEGYFITPQNTTHPLCRPCFETCKECEASPKICTQCYETEQNRILDANKNSCVCKPGYVDILDTPVCQLECKFNFYRDQDYSCKQCHDSCSACNGGEATDCTDCPSGFYLTVQDNQGTSSCNVCNSTCLTCNNADADDCESCSAHTNRVLSENQCICKEGYEQDIQSGDCVKKCQTNEYRVNNDECNNCHYTCKTCTSDSFTTCLKCDEKLHNRVLDNAQCKPKVGFVDVGDNKAVPCDYTCKTCISEPSNCETCADGRFQSNGTGPCVCNVSTFEFEGSCSPCKEECLTCSDENTCDSCQPDAGVVENGQCICEKGKYLLGKRCELCDLTCETCIDFAKTSCESCYESQNREEINAECVPKEGYFEEGTPSAGKCDLSCKACLPPGTADDCTKCHENQHLEKIAQADETGKCVADEKFFILDHVAVPCHRTCKECTGAANDECTDCIDGRVEQLNRGQCPCPTGSYDDKFEDAPYCSPCHITCLTCFGEQQDECITCDSTAAQTKRIYDNHTCVCPEISYYQDNTVKVCKECHFSCKTCSEITGNLSNEECVECPSLREAKSPNTCTPVPGYYETGVKVPEKCHYTCETCDGPLKTECLTCKASDNRKYDANTKTCPPESQFFEEPDEPKAKPCSIQCDECTANTDYGFACCENPAENYVWAEGSDGSTTEKCTVKPAPEHYHTPEGAKDCNPKCKECTDGTETDCTDCHTNYTLKGTECIVNPKFYEETPGEAQPCDPTCATCSDAGKQACKLCNINVHREITQQNECVCLPKFYESNGLCKHCNVTCATCSEAVKCKTCNQNNFRQYNGVDESCEPIDGYYENDQEVPAKCDDSAAKCDGPTNEDCLEPADGYTLNGKTCTKNCQKHCLTCDTEKCTKCSPNTELNIENIHECEAKPKFYENPGGQIIPCDLPCDECTDSGMNCKNCIPNYYLLENTTQCLIKDLCDQFDMGIFATTGDQVRTHQIECPDNKHDINEKQKVSFTLDYTETPEEETNVLRFGDETKDCDDQVFVVNVKPNNTLQIVIGLQNDQTITYEPLKLKPGKKYNVDVRFDGTKNYIVIRINNIIHIENLDYINGTASINNTFYASDNCKPPTNSWLSNVKLEDFTYDDHTIVPPVECHYTCLTCSGPAEINCYTCDANDNRTFKPETNSCPAEPGHYEVINQKEAPPCSIQCKECTSNTNNGFDCCTEEAENYQFVEGTECTVEPSPNHYHSPEGSKPCETSCKECTEGTNQDCTECYDNFTLTKDQEINETGTCIVNPGFYPKTPKSADPCDESCLTCDDADNKACTGCRTGDNFTLTAEKMCVCEPLHSLVNSVCVLCHFSCLTCTGTQDNECETCDEQDNHRELIDGNKCPPKDGFFEKGVAVTDPCDVSAAKCDGPLHTDCLEPNPQYVLKANDTCIPICTDYCQECTITECKVCKQHGEVFINDKKECIAEPGFYIDDPAKEIKACPSPCNLCKLTESQTMFCITCLTGYQPGSVAGTCEEEVPELTECHYTCDTCKEGGQTENDCLTCNDTRVFTVDSVNTDLQSCPPKPGHYEAPAQPNAPECSVQCEECTSNQNDGFSCCTVPAVNYKYDPELNDGCTVKPKQTFYHSPQGAKPCDSSCLECSGPSNDNCSLCYLNFSLDKGMCIIDPGFFTDTPTETPNDSTPCHYTCKTCDGALETNCKTCDPDNRNRVLTNGNSCPAKPGFFDDEGENNPIAQPCSTQCEECTDNSNNGYDCCTVPAFGYEFVDPLVGCTVKEIDSSIKLQDEGTSINIDLGENDNPGCAECHYSCKTCEEDPAKLETQCLTCFQYREYNPATKTCEPKTGFFDDGNREPVACLSPCVQCKGTASYCTLCENSYNELTDGVCSNGEDSSIKLQDEGTSINIDVGENNNPGCAECHYSCKTCEEDSAKLETQCLTCFIYRVYNSVTKTCEPKPGFFDDGNREPVACLSPCVQCKGAANYCTECEDTNASLEIGICSEDTSITIQQEGTSIQFGVEPPCDDEETSIKLQEEGTSIDLEDQGHSVTLVPKGQTGPNEQCGNEIN